MFPLIVSAQTNFDNSGYINSIIESVRLWVNNLLPLMVGIAMLVFFYGVVKYIWGAADGKAGAKDIMIWGVVAIAVMVSIWGLVGLLQGITGVGGSNAVNQIQIPTTGEVQ